MSSSRPIGIGGSTVLKPAQPPVVPIGAANRAPAPARLPVAAIRPGRKGGADGK